MAYPTEVEVGVTQGDDEKSSQQRYLFCPHCTKMLSKSTYYRHRQQYYNHISGTWATDLESETHTGSDWVTIHGSQAYTSSLVEDMITESSDIDPQFTVDSSPVTEPQPLLNQEIPEGSYSIAAPAIQLYVIAKVPIAIHSY